MPLEDVVDDGIAAIQRAIFLKKAGVETAVDEKFLTAPPNRSDLLEDGIINLIRYVCMLEGLCILSLAFNRELF